MMDYKIYNYILIINIIKLFCKNNLRYIAENIHDGLSDA